MPLEYAHYGFRDHRGAIILTLGILSLVIQCFPLGIVAWVMANNDLREMDAGVMDPSGRDLTQAGKICGMISVLLIVVGLVIWVMFACLATSLSAFATSFA